MRHFLALLLSTFLLQTLSVQAEDALRKELRLQFDSIIDCRDDSVKLAIHKRISQKMEEVLKDERSFADPFADLPHIGKIYSDDGKVRFYTWGFPMEDKTFQFGGFVQYKGKDGVATTRLQTLPHPFRPSENKEINPEKWYGALYYKAFKVKKRRAEYYIALGWSGHDAVTDFKVIEPIQFEEDGTLKQLGLDIFQNKGKRNPPLRAVFEYNSEGKMTLDYQPQTETIIFDHLTPIDPSYTGIRAYYGPDFTYDAYHCKKGEWVFEENIDARNNP